jgi:hypothetical protein
VCYFIRAGRVIVFRLCVCACVMISMMTLVISLQFNLFELLTYYLKGCVKISVSSDLNYKVWTVFTWSNSKFSAQWTNRTKKASRCSLHTNGTMDPWPAQSQRVLHTEHAASFKNECIRSHAITRRSVPFSANSVWTLFLCSLFLSNTRSVS